MLFIVLEPIELGKKRMTQELLKRKKLDNTAQPLYNQVIDYY